MNTSHPLTAPSRGPIPSQELPDASVNRRRARWLTPAGGITALTLTAIAAHLVLRFGLRISAPVAGVRWADLPLLAAIVFGGLPLVLDLARHVIRREFSADLLAGISIITSVALGEYLAGALVVLMLAGGQALEAYAVRSASSVLEALARRMPATAHRKDPDARDESV